MKNHLEICLRPIARGISAKICSYTQKKHGQREGFYCCRKSPRKTKSALFQLLPG